MTKRLLKGNEAAVLGALMGGCTHFFGYPITPASEIAQAASFYFTKAGRVFLQGESEVSVINMIYGASSAGKRVMSASSGPGIALMSEGFSYLAGARLPNVVIDMQRAGPGLGNIWPEQSDYNMVVKGGGHGNYKNIVLAPASAQEMYDFTKIAFSYADTYRMSVIILGDGYIGQVMEKVEIDGEVEHTKRKDWAVYGDKESRENLISSIYMSPALMSQHNQLLQDVYKKVEQEIVDFEEVNTEDAQVIFITYGIVSRICHSAVQKLRALGIKAGMLRLITLFPFPKEKILSFATHKTPLIVVELSNGQMMEDVILSTRYLTKIIPFLRMGGEIPTVKELVDFTSLTVGVSKKENM
ncbi:MAG: 3-methyl-2-oxobutanoate dehydrogenase subunit VorB [Spirochaetia bacterium]|nr:3-methyl-2-oxobutanoate dehydrogenase subunit VorB [Spirochaetia bacterium]